MAPSYKYPRKLCHYPTIHLSSVQLLSCAQQFVTPWTAACQVPLSITNSQSKIQVLHPISPFASNLLSLQTSLPRSTRKTTQSIHFSPPPLQPFTSTHYYMLPRQLN